MNKFRVFSQLPPSPLLFSTESKKCQPELTFHLREPLTCSLASFHLFISFLQQRGGGYQKGTLYVAYMMTKIKSQCNIMFKTNSQSFSQLATSVTNEKPESNKNVTNGRETTTWIKSMIDTLMCSRLHIIGHQLLGPSIIGRNSECLL